MTKTQFRTAIRELIEQDVNGLSLDEKIAVMRQCLIEAQEQLERNESNKGKPWSDEELRLVLQHAPTKENCILLARAFCRGYGSIEQIFRWAASSKDEIESKRSDDAFVKQIKRIASEIGWRAT